MTAEVKPPMTTKDAYGILEGADLTRVKGEVAVFEGPNAKFVVISSPTNPELVSELLHIRYETRPDDQQPLSIDEGQLRAAAPRTVFGQRIELTAELQRELDKKYGDGNHP